MKLKVLHSENKGPMIKYLDPVINRLIVRCFWTSLYNLPAIFSVNAPSKWFIDTYVICDPLGNGGKCKLFSLYPYK